MPLAPTRRETNTYTWYCFCPVRFFRLLLSHSLLRQPSRGCFHHRHPPSHSPICLPWLDSSELMERGPRSFRSSRTTGGSCLRLRGRYKVGCFSAPCNVCVRASFGIPCQAPVGVNVSVSECIVACPSARNTQYCNQTITIYIILL